MKRLFSLIAFSLITLFLHAQELTESHINKVDPEGRRQGDWRIYDGEGNLKFTGAFHDGKPIGEFRFFYPNGKIKAIIIQQDSGRVSYATNYHLNGNVLAKGKYVNQMKDSTWLYYSELDGALASEEYYRNGIKEGVWKVYYPEGGVMEEITYKNDLKDGPWNQYFTDGAVKQTSTYAKGLLEGPFIVYHINGKVEVSGSYIHDNKDGTWIYLTEIGELVKKEEYRNGRLIAEEINEIDK